MNRFGQGSRYTGGPLPLHEEVGTQAGRVIHQHLHLVGLHQAE